MKTTCNHEFTLWTVVGVLLNLERRGAASGRRPTSEPWRDLPDQEQQEHRGQEVVALVVEQVVDDAVVPPVQVAHVGHGEPGRAQEKVIQAAEGWRLHVCHLFSPWPTIRLAFPECRAGGSGRGPAGRGVCHRVSRVGCLLPADRRSREARPRESRARSLFRAGRNADAENSVNFRFCKVSRFLPW